MASPKFTIAPIPVLLLAMFSLLSTESAAQDQYTVRVADDLATIEVRACFAGQPPAYLYRHRDAARFTDRLEIGGREVNTSSRRLSLRGLPKDTCASWRVNLAAAVKGSDYRTALQMDEAIVTAGSLWFWRDSKQRAVEVQLYLPQGMQFSAPWTLVASIDGVLHYQPADTPASWSSRLAFGRFATKSLDISGGRINIAMLGSFDPAQQAVVQQWIAEPVRAVAEVIGQFPVAQTQVLVVGIGPRSSPVPWAHVLRGGGMAVELFVDQTRSLEELRKDWTATHEFSHFLLPYVGSDDRWLSEGLASYYQNVLRARDGRLSELQAWQKLLGGFQRGQSDGETGGTMDTYWRGAALLLQADSRLRELSAGQQSLDTALAQLHACCPGLGQRWSAADLLQQMDQLTGYTVFSEVYDIATASPEFPNPVATLQKLGVEREDGSVQLDDAAPWSNTRQSIMSEAAGHPVGNIVSSDAAQAPDP